METLRRTQPGIGQKQKSNLEKLKKNRGPAGHPDPSQVRCTRWSPTPCCHHRATTAAAVPPLGGMRAVPSHDHHRRAPLPHTHMPCCCCDVCAITGWCAIKTHRQPVLLLLGMLLLPLVPPHSPALPHHHRRAHSRAPLPHTRMPCCGCDVCAIAWWSAQDAAAAARAAASTRSRTTTGAPTHARRHARSSSAHLLTS